MPQFTKKNFLGVKNPDWWTQECPAVLHLCYGFMMGFAHIGQYFKKDYGVVIVPVSNDYGIHYLDKKRSIALAEHVLDNFIKDSSYLSRVIKKWNRYRAKLLSVYKQIEKSQPNKLTDQELWQLYRRLFDAYLKEYTPAMIVEAFEPYTAQVFYPRLASFPEAIRQDLKILEQPTFQSFLSQHQIGLMRLALTAGKNRSLLAILNSEKSNEEKLKEIDKKHVGFYRQLLKHQKAYFWLSNNYRDAKVLSLSHFFGLVISELKTKGMGQIQQEIDRLLASLKKLAIQKKQIRKKLSAKNLPARTLAFYDLLEMIGPWHDERKRLMLMSSHFLTVILHAIGRRFGYALVEMWYTQPDEIRDLILKSRPISHEVLKERRKLSVWIGSKDKEFLFSGEKAGEIMSVIDAGRKIGEGKIITGIPASVGVVQGKARVVLDVDRDEFNDGEILVATMTRPEFVPLMKRAAAIVTNEGGLTCHAAIVARELGIPCVVGTRVATKILKSGDIVEVRAHRGEVRIL